MSEIDASIIKKTQDTLGKYVKKPVLSEKLLKKPPFRFLYDVFNAVIKETGAFEGLYSADELNYDNISDREAKMKFLQKMIDAIKIATNEPLTVRTSKIVAGHEPEKTNELLQLLGTVIEKKIDWKPAVDTINTGNSPSKPKEKLKDKESKEKKTTDKSPKIAASKKTDHSKEKTKTEVKEKTKTKEIKEKSSRKSLKANDSDQKEEKKLRAKPSSRESTKKTPSKKEGAKPRQPEPEPEPEPQIEIQKKVEKNDKAIDDSKREKAIVGTEELQEVKEDKKIDSPSEALSPSSVDFKKDERRASKRAEEILLTAAAENISGGNETRRSSGRKRSSGKSRKSSAEKDQNSNLEDSVGKNSFDAVESLKSVAEEPLAEVVEKPPSKPQQGKSSSPNSEVKRESTFVREDSKEMGPASRPRTSLRPPSARPASARPGAPRRRDKNIEIILQPNDQIKLSGISVKLDTFNSELEDDGENLVIIENANTEDQLEGNISKDRNETVEDSLQQGHLVQQILETQKELAQGSSDAERQQEKERDTAKLNSRQSSARQMNSLRDVIQNLTKSVNPLGKLMDFIPEDIDAMQLELAMWRDTYNQSSVELKKERSLTESVTEPMKNQLVTIESNIKEYREMIDECRAKILQNADRIQKLLTNQ